MYEQETDDPEPLRVAVYLLVYLAKNHCFADGNKRVAWMALTDYLIMLGLTIKAEQVEVEEFVNNISAAQGARADIAHAWIAARLVALP